MPIHFVNEVEKTKKRLLELSSMVEHSLRDSVKCFVTSDADLAKKIIEYDQDIDNMEIDVEEECLKVLALYQPVASDLRFIVAILKINSDLERIGDHAVSIAKRTLLSIDSKPAVVDPFNFDKLIELSLKMLKLSIDALINQDSEQALDVIRLERDVDSIEVEGFSLFLDKSKHNPDAIEYNTHTMFVSRYLERIADHAVNIAEDVIYMVNGTIVRHSDPLKNKDLC